MSKLSDNKIWLEKTRANNKSKGKPVKTDRNEIFESVSEAARQTGALNPNIRLCIRGKIKSCMGRKWFYC